MDAPNDSMVTELQIYHPAAQFEQPGLQPKSILPFDFEFWVW